ncbi:MAG: hypothetical protein AAGF12_03530 [Myxococcota bacterium]
MSDRQGTNAPDLDLELLRRLLGFAPSSTTAETESVVDTLRTALANRGAGSFPEPAARESHDSDVPDEENAEENDLGQRGRRPEDQDRG